MERNSKCSQSVWDVLTQTPRGKFDETLWLLESKPSVGYSTENKSALHDAILNGKLEHISEIVKKENNVDIRSGSSNQTPIHWAAKLGRLECLKRLSNCGGSLTAEDGSEDGNSAIHLAVIHGQDKITRWLIDNGVCVNITNSKGITPLLYATRYGYTNLVQTLVENGANVNCHTSCLNNATPLHIAVLKNNEDVIKTLLKSGADPTLFCSYNQTPLHWASAYGNLQSLKIMETYGADLSIQMNDESGYQAIHLAAGSGHMTVVEWFLEKGISVECPSKLGFTPLHLAVVSGQMTTAKFLLKRGAQVK
jgi:ankyrin